jgi:hypothetical protein
MTTRARRKFVATILSDGGIGPRKRKKINPKALQNVAAVHTIKPLYVFW